MSKKILITGGAGFIGVHTVSYFSKQGWEPIIFDNLSRKGTKENLEWLKNECKFEFIEGDIQNNELLEEVFKRNKFSAVIHLAAQVAVTTSVKFPREDFNINAYGTFNLIEAARKYSPDSPFIYASTNKVYGKMDDLKIVVRNGRYEYKDVLEGVSENYRLDFYSPYGCSKGSGDQYVLDYSRIYGIPATCFRQSCIYGTRQFGVEDQGWVAWFTIASILQKPLTIYGDGRQIRDILYVDDLVRSYELAINNPDMIAGKAFNIGGGKNNTLSLLELVNILETKMQKKLPIVFDDWRPGDQKVFVCDTSLADNQFGFESIISVNEGVDNLVSWVNKNKTEINNILSN